MFSDKDAVNEIRDYLNTGPEHKRDRDTFHREQFMKARQILAELPDDEHGLAESA